MATSITHVDCFSHIPGVQLEMLPEVIIGACSLMALSFDEWLSLEDPAFGCQQGRYERANPVFFKRSFALDGEVDDERLVTDVQNHFLADVQRLSFAILFTLWNPKCPEPSRSVSYFKLAEAGLTKRILGLNERELIFIPDDNKALELAHIQRITNIFRRLTEADVGEDTPEILRVIDAVRISAEPDMNVLDVITNFVAVHEDILNSAGDKPLGPTFARRAGRLFCPRFDQLPAFQSFFETMYAIRSDMLHGREVSAERLEKLNQSLSKGIILFLFFKSYETCCQLSFLKYNHRTIEEGLAVLLSELDQVRDDDILMFDRLKQKLFLTWLET